MRVLHIYSGNLFGGIEGMLITIARSAKRMPNLESHFALCFEGQLANELRSAGASVQMLGPVRMSRPWMVLAGRQSLRRAISRIKPNALVCHSPWPLALFGPVARQKQLPLVFWTHQFLTRKGFDEKWASWCRPDLVICNSIYTSKSVDTLFRNIPTEVVYCPYQFERVEPTDSLRNEVRAELETPLDARVVFQASRLEWWKGHRLHIRALGQLRNLPSWVCWIAGGVQRPQEIAYFDELQSLAKQLGIGDRVRFLGHRKDIPRLLAAADIVCQPNESPEHFGIAFIEGLAAGRPVVTTRMGGALEIVDSSCGMLLDPEPVELASALRGLFEDRSRCESLGLAGIARAEEICGPVRNLTRFHDIMLKHFGEIACTAT